MSPSLVTIATKTHTNIFQLLRSRPSCTHFLFFGTRLFPQRKNVTQHSCLSIQSLSLSLSLSGTQHSATPAVFFLSPSQSSQNAKLYRHIPPQSLSLCRYSSHVLITTNLLQLLAPLLLLTSPLSPGSSSTPSPRLPLLLLLLLLPDPAQTLRSKHQTKPRKQAHLQGPDVGDEDDHHNNPRERRRRRRRLPEAPETRTKCSVESSLQAAAATRHKRPAPRPDPPTRGGRCPPGRPPFFAPNEYVFLNVYTKRMYLCINVVRLPLWLCIYQIRMYQCMYVYLLECCTASFVGIYSPNT